METTQVSTDTIENVSSNSIPSVITTSAITTNVDDTIVGKKRKLFSNVWNDFQKENINGKVKAICNHCKKQLIGDSKNDTKHLWAHLRTCPKLKMKDINQMNQKYLKAEKGEDGITKIVNMTFDQDVSRKKLARMIIRHDYPLSIVDHEGFRDFVNSIQPLFTMISRNTL
ncbi:zinc finger BED domain-containing protein RICESLEEPER 3-like [Impatiens glandulifera]|uniref:zinc finger BED domain-containing protein RICESLEEPER 3-like n=1 Tax=Impatiens glandulifera TaxID=253017 RepID=UPI001FB1796E|nr:zinc finger BED domain-containing protein RICESLEEPER 3-like [Impatiens glandulifera]